MTERERRNVLAGRIAKLEDILGRVRQLCESGGHDGLVDACPTCHVLAEINEVMPR
jgi:hypothetical protein